MCDIPKTMYVFTHHFVVCVIQSSPQAWLDSHNVERAMVGTPPLVWNQSLVDYAQNYANSRYEKCEFVHSMGPYGESIAMGYNDMTGSDAVKFWCTEKADYDHASNTCRAGEWECGHYTQVVARKTISVGCARAKCKNNWMFVICSYYPCGNIIGEKPYWSYNIYNPKYLCGCIRMRFFE